jgi:hypothetical protein
LAVDKELRALSTLTPKDMPDYFKDLRPELARHKARISELESRIPKIKYVDSLRRIPYIEGSVRGSPSDTVSSGGLPHLSTVGRRMWSVMAPLLERKLTSTSTQMSYDRPSAGHLVLSMQRDAQAYALGLPRGLEDVGTAWDGDHNWPGFVRTAAGGAPSTRAEEVDERTSSRSAVVPPIPYAGLPRRCVRFVCPYGLLRACATRVDERGVTEAPVWLDTALKMLAAARPVEQSRYNPIGKIVLQQAVPSDRAMRGHEYVTSSGVLKQRSMERADPRVLSIEGPSDQGRLVVRATSCPLGPIGFQRVVDEQEALKRSNAAVYRSAWLATEPVAERTSWSWNDIAPNSEWAKLYKEDRFGALLQAAAASSQLGNTSGLSLDLEQARCVTHAAERLVQGALLLAAHSWKAASSIRVELPSSMKVADGDFMDHQHRGETTARLACAAALAGSVLGAHLPLGSVRFVLEKTPRSQEWGPGAEQHDKVVERVLSRFEARLQRLYREASACTLGEASLAAAAVLAQERERERDDPGVSGR